MNSGKSKALADSGIKLYDVENVTVSKNNCSKNLFGIFVKNSKLNLIENNICSGNIQNGIFLEMSNYTKIHNNICNDNSWGITLYFSKFNIAINNTCCYNLADGIQVFVADFNIVINNTCNSNDFNGISIPMSNQTKVSNNSCNSNGIYGILLNEANLNLISNNSCSFNLINGIRLQEDANLNYVLKNLCNNNSFNGISIQSSSNSNIIKYNNCDSNTWLGITLQESSNNNDIKKNYCTNNYGGIGLYSNSNLNLIINNTCLYNYGGINSNNSQFNKIINNNCSFNTLFGIHLSLNYDILIENNICNQNERWGISNDMSSSIKVANNSCTLNNDIDIRIAVSEGLILTKNLLGMRGINIDGLTFEHYCTHSIDTSNIVDGKPIYYWRDRSGGIIPTDAGQVFLANCENICLENQNIQNRNMSIGIYYSNSITVRYNSIKNNFFGIFSHYSTDNLIYNNSCNYNYNFGLHILNSQDNIIFNNSFDLNRMFGLAAQNSNDCSIVRNNASNNGRSGILIRNSEKCIIEKNLIKNNNNHGILFNISDNNIIWKNEISFNGEAGIKLNTSNNNKIYYNSIIDNSIQTFEMGICNYNHFDNGNGEGNYWSDYSGLDNGSNGRIAGDGIGDTKIPHLGLDNYPFINDSGWLQPGIPILYEFEEFASDGNYTIHWQHCRGAVRYVLEEDTTIDFDSPRIIYNGSKFYFRYVHKSNGSYFYRLKGFSEHHESVWSNIVDMNVDWPPDPPKNLSVLSLPEGNALKIFWDSDNIDIASYELYYKIKNYDVWEFLTSVTHPTTNYTHSNLKDGTEYLYRVKSKDFRGQYSRYSVIFSGIPQDLIPPAPPKGLNIVNITNRSIELSWEPNLEPDLDGYNIYRYTTTTSNGWGDLIGSVPAENVTFIDIGLTGLTTYFYVITAFDEVPNESDFSNVVFGTTKKVLHPPEINHSILDFDMDEDTIDNSTINLYHWFKDPNNDPLIFRCEGANHLNVTINHQTGDVILMPEDNWYGSETLIFYAFDSIFECSDAVKITVNPVNDPPGLPVIIEPEHNLEIKNGMLLNFSGFCNDPDLPEDELTFVWYSNIQGRLGLGKNLTAVELIPGIHEIILTVTDNSNEDQSTNITIHVFEERSITSDKDTAENYFIILIVSIIVIILILLIIASIHKKHKKEKYISRSEVSTPLRFSFLKLRVDDSSDIQKNESSINIDLKKEKQTDRIETDHKLVKDKK